MKFIDEDSKDLKEVYLIVNGELKKRTIPVSEIIESNGLLYHYDDYGMGSVWWSIVDEPKNAYSRQMKDNVLWAEDRLKWAKKHNSKEVIELIKIIETKGESRTPGYYLPLLFQVGEV